MIVIFHRFTTIENAKNCLNTEYCRVEKQSKKKMQNCSLCHLSLSNGKFHTNSDFLWLDIKELHLEASLMLAKPFTFYFKPKKKLKNGKKKKKKKPLQ